MAQATYSARVLVLRKTKLNESDLICTFLAEDGSQVRAVAKGARKPTSSFASRLELFSIDDVLFAKGRNLDIVKEARLVEGFDPLRTSLEHTACASSCVEFLDRVSQLGLQSPMLFALAQAAFVHMGASDSPKAIQQTAAFLLKALSYAGVRPSLAHCVSCGADMDALLNDATATMHVSYQEGGVLCEACHPGYDTVPVPAPMLSWAHSLLHATFDQIDAFPVDDDVSFALLLFCQTWARTHFSINLKSLNFLFSCASA